MENKDMIDFAARSEELRAAKCNAAIKEADLERQPLIDLSIQQAETTHTRQYSQGAQQIVQEANRALICKQEPLNRLRESTLIAFIALAHVTKEHSLSEGALLLEILDLETGKVVEQWLPKKLCSNLDEENCTVYVWTPFLEDNCPQYIPEDEV